MQYQEYDVTAIGIHLNELRSKFDRMIREGGVYDDVKKIYGEIKELECYQNALQWDADQHAHNARLDMSVDRRTESFDTLPLLL